MIPGPSMANAMVMAEAHRATHLPINEVFGPTIEGEGRYVGQRCFFVRTGKCNLHCHWCDTWDTWDKDRLRQGGETLEDRNPDTPILEVAQRLLDKGAQPGDTIVLSGGEPLIHTNALPHLLDEVGHGYRWHVESNGTIPPPSWAHRFHHVTLSPKVAQTDDAARKRIKPRVLAKWADWAYQDGVVTPRLAVKFVVDCSASYRISEQVQEVRQIAAQAGFRSSDVWLMPEGTNAAAIVNAQRLLVGYATMYGFNLSTRLHTLIWNDERGR
jgi:7-carboxy-7-deazaguanine synthase